MPLGDTATAYGSSSFGSLTVATIVLSAVSMTLNTVFEYRFDVHPGPGRVRGKVIRDVPHADVACLMLATLSSFDRSGQTAPPSDEMDTYAVDVAALRGAEGPRWRRDGDGTAMDPAILLPQPNNPGVLPFIAPRVNLNRRNESYEFL